MKSPGEPRGPRPVRQVELIKVVKTTAVTGNGIDGTDPVREIEQYFTMDGEHLFTRDRWAEGQKSPDPVPDPKAQEYAGALHDLTQADAALGFVTYDFTTAMALDLLRADREGKEGWDSIAEYTLFMEELLAHIERERFVGAANFCMFLWHLKQKEVEACQDAPSSSTAAK